MSPGITADNPALQPPNQPTQSTTVETPPVAGADTDVSDQSYQPDQPPAAPPPVAPQQPPAPVLSQAPSLAPAQVPQQPPPAPVNMPPSTPAAQVAVAEPPEKQKKGKGKLIAGVLAAGCLLTVVLGVAAVGVAGVGWFLLAPSSAPDFASPSDAVAPYDTGIGALVAEPFEDGLADPDVLPPAPGADATAGDPLVESEPAPPVQEPVRDEPAPVSDDAAADTHTRASTDHAADEPAPSASVSRVSIEHSPATMSVVGDSLTLRATTPGHDDCTLKLQYKAAGQSWRSMTMSRSGSTHSQILSVDSTLSPSFDYYLVATDCGAGLWPADGSKQTVKVF